MCFPCKSPRSSLSQIRSISSKSYFDIEKYNVFLNDVDNFKVK